MCSSERILLKKGVFMMNDKLKEQAKTLFIKGHMTQEELARKLNISERTIRRWKQAEGWKQLRDDFRQNSISFHQELYLFAKKLILSIRKDIEKGIKIDTGRLFAISKLLPLIKLVKEYEDSVAKSKAANAVKNTNISSKTIKQIQGDILGLDTAT